ncbi:hypothetical protein CFB43_35125 [Burkholderia sp. AU15512]|nr:hypothetical protein CFB43_35125 [Burkholderia sp. AU15512]
MLFLHLQCPPVGGFGETVALLQDIAHGCQLGGPHVDAMRRGVPLNRHGDERRRAVGEQRGRQPVTHGRAAPRREMSVVLGFDLPLPLALDIKHRSRLRGTGDCLLQLKLTNKRDVERTVPLRSARHDVASSKVFSDAIA